LFGQPDTLVCNYDKTGVLIFAKIDTLKFDDLPETIIEILEGVKRYRDYLKNQSDE